MGTKETNGLIVISGGVFAFTIPGAGFSKIFLTTMVLRHEDLTTDIFDILKNISVFLELDLNDDHTQFGIDEVSKEKCKKMSLDYLTVIRKDSRDPEDWFSKENLKFFVAPARIT